MGLCASGSSARTGVALAARLIPRNLTPDRAGMNEVWAKLRADQWQPIRAMLSTVVIVGIALYQGEIASGWGICVLLVLAGASGLRIQDPIWCQLGLLGAVADDHGQFRTLRFPGRTGTVPVLHARWSIGWTPWSSTAGPDVEIRGGCPQRKSGRHHAGRISFVVISRRRWPAVRGHAAGTAR